MLKQLGLIESAGQQSGGANRKGRIPIDRDKDEGRKGQQRKFGFSNSSKKKQMGTAMNRVIEVPRPKAGSHANERE